MHQFNPQNTTIPSRDRPLWLYKLTFSRLVSLEDFSTKQMDHTWLAWA